MSDGIVHEDKLLLHKDSAWHGLGIIHGDFINREDIDKAGLTFKAEKRQLEYDGLQIKAWGVFNADTNTFIAPCGEEYAVHLPAVIFDTMDAILGAEDGGKYETAGIIGDFNKVWGLADINASFRVGDDVTKQYLAGLTSFDGSAASHFFQTNVRIVCQNTWNAALNQAAASALRVRHTSKSHRKLHDAAEQLKAIKADFMTMGERMNFLAERYVNPVDMTNILDQVIAKPVGTNKEMTELQLKRRQNVLDEILELYESNDDNAYPEQRGSVFNLFNAVTNYVDHQRATRTFDDESTQYKRSVAALTGSGNKLKNDAMNVLVQYATKASPKPFQTTIVPVNGLLDQIISEA